MAHTVIPPPRGTTTTLELAHTTNINDKTIPERDREVRDFNVTLVARSRRRAFCPSNKSSKSVLTPLRVEFLLKTESGYLRDAEVT